MDMETADRELILSLHHWTPERLKLTPERSRRDSVLERVSPLSPGFQLLQLFHSFYELLFTLTMNMC